VIGSPRAYSSRNRRLITWVSNYRYPIWTFVIGYDYFLNNIHETITRFWLAESSANEKKMVSRKIFRHFLDVNFFMFILLISNHTVFPIQFGINLHLWVFQKAETALVEAARAISAFWKTHPYKLIPNWTRKTVWLPIRIVWPNY